MAGHHGTGAGVVESTLRAAVAERLGEARFGLWFGEGVRLGVDGDVLEVGVPNAFFREWIQGHFAGNLIEAAETVTGRESRSRSSQPLRPRPRRRRRTVGPRTARRDGSMTS
jgi:chromosomal replication initiator protein